MPTQIEFCAFLRAFTRAEERLEFLGQGVDRRGLANSAGLSEETLEACIQQAIENGFCRPASNPHELWMGDEHAVRDFLSSSPGGTRMFVGTTTFAYDGQPREEVREAATALALTIDHGLTAEVNFGPTEVVVRLKHLMSNQQKFEELYKLFSTRFCGALMTLADQAEARAKAAASNHSSISIHNSHVGAVGGHGSVVTGHQINQAPVDIAELERLLLAVVERGDVSDEDKKATQRVAAEITKSGEGAKSLMRTLPQLVLTEAMKLAVKDGWVHLVPWLASLFQ